MTLGELEKLLGGDKERSLRIQEVSKDVLRYIFYADSIDLGIVYSPKDLSFSDMLLFKWIKDGLNVRKN